MTHKHGAHLGGVRSVDDVRLRCVIDEDTGCWHLRTARGRPQPIGKGQGHKLWVHGVGCVSAPKAVWTLNKGIPLPKGRKAVRVCDSYDCANPEHIRALTHSESQRRIVRKSMETSPKVAIQLKKLNLARRRFTDEQVAEVRQSNESVASIARRWKCQPSLLSAIRRGDSYRDDAFALVKVV